MCLVSISYDPHFWVKFTLLFDRKVTKMVDYLSIGKNNTEDIWQGYRGECLVSESALGFSGSKSARLIFPF